MVITLILTIQGNVSLVLKYKINHNIPLKFYEPEEEVYHNGPIMWNTAVLHGSDPSPTERIFYQVELKDNNTFDYYVEQYKNNKLLK